MYFLTKFCNYFLGDITTFCKLFSQTDEKLLKKLPLEIMFVVLFWFWLGNSMAHTKIVAVRATLVQFLFRKHEWICGTVLLKLTCESLKSDENCSNRSQFLVTYFKNYANQTALVGFRF
jgi:hypothetical protein